MIGSIADKCTIEKIAICEVGTKCSLHTNMVVYILNYMDFVLLLLQYIQPEVVLTGEK